MEGHGIRYENAAVHWTEALPLGNGTFGAMAYLQDAHMRLSMNHYEVYYSGLPDYSRTAQKTQRHYQKAGGDTKAAYVQRAKSGVGNRTAARKRIKRCCFRRRKENACMWRREKACRQWETFRFAMRRKRTVGNVTCVYRWNGQRFPTGCTGAFILWKRQ